MWVLIIVVYINTISPKVCKTNKKQNKKWLIGYISNTFICRKSLKAESIAWSNLKTCERLLTKPINNSVVLQNLQSLEKVFDIWLEFDHMVF